MEIAIAVFIGVWIAAAGIVAMIKVFKDFPKDSEKEGDV